MNITVMRHAQSTHNASGDNSWNVGLTEEGRLQAREVSGEYDLVICSTLRRAQQTLEFSSIKSL